MLKLSENPPILSAGFESLVDFEGTWWVAHTKARFEKAFAWALSGYDINYFLPMRRKITFSGGRKRQVMVPLFSSYVFFCGTEKDRYTAMTTNRLCHTIEVFDQGQLISELTAIEKTLFNKAIIDLYPKLAVGSRARVVSGPLIGIEGVVIERKNEKARMVLQVTMLGQGALVEIDADLLESISVR